MALHWVYFHNCQYISRNQEQYVRKSGFSPMSLYCGKVLWWTSHSFLLSLAFSYKWAQALDPTSLNLSWEEKANLYQDFQFYMLFLLTFSQTKKNQVCTLMGFTVWREAEELGVHGSEVIRLQAYLTLLRFALLHFIHVAFFFTN